MNSTYNFIDSFAALTNSEVLAYSDNPKQGFLIKNEEMNMKLHIFSDKTPRIYFEFSPIKIDKTNYLALDYPTYGIENFDEAKPILDRIVQLLDSNKNLYKQNEQEYISLFRKLFRNETLPEGYSSGQGEHFIKIEKKTEKLVLYVLMEDVERVRSEGLIASEATAIHCIALKDQKNKDKPVFMYIPQYMLAEYPVLKKESKIHNSSQLITSFDSWIKELQDTTDRERTAFNDLVDYIALDKTVASKPESGTTKKPKI